MTPRQFVARLILFAVIALPLIAVNASLFWLGGFNFDSRGIGAMCFGCSVLSILIGSFECTVRLIKRAQAEATHGRR